MKRPAVLLDRDGTLNEDPGDRGWVTAADDLRPVPGALAAVARLNGAGWPVSVVTNQSCIGRGLASAADVDGVNVRLAELAAAHGASFDGILVCPHAPEEGCICRKPLPGLLLEAAARFGYDLFASYLVGDSRSDLLAARAAGVTPLLVRTGKGESEALLARHPEHRTFGSLAEAVDWILSQPREGG